MKLQCNDFSGINTPTGDFLAKIFCFECCKLATIITNTPKIGGNTSLLHHVIRRSYQKSFSILRSLLTISINDIWMWPNLVYHCDPDQITILFVIYINTLRVEKIGGINL
jgi:hypothetical protein